jgi:hypothetical protein
LGPAGEFVPDEDRVDVDVSGVIRRLLLFDTFILDSARLREIPRLVSRFGSSGLIDLLKSGTLKIQCEAYSIASAGQGLLPGQGPEHKLPLCSYRLGVTWSPDPDRYIGNCLKYVDKIGGMELKQTIKLKRAIVDNIVRSPIGTGFPALASTKTDLGNTSLLQVLVARAAKAISNIDVASEALRVRAELLEADAIRLESNLRELGFDHESEHKVLERALLAVAGMNYRVEEMSNFSAISGLLEDEAQFLTSKVGFLLRDIAPQPAERRFDRVVQIAGLPDFDSSSTDLIDVQKLLKVRESPECLEFREWLQRTDLMSDEQIREQVGALNSKVASVLQSTAGKTARFLVTKVLGNVLAPGAGTALEVVDAFLLDLVCRRSGPAVFLNRLYPSILRPKL